MDFAQVTKDLKKLADIASEFGLEEEAQKPLERIADLQLGTFVMIVGEGNFGKSSLINAIARQEIAATSVLPKTARVDIYTAAPDRRARALLRRRGDPKWKEFKWSQALKICAEDESRIARGEESKLADALWYVPDTCIPEGVCLVDTPGLSQDLLGKLQPRSLVAGIDATYSIEDVWAYWIHRADFVLWVFEANRIESKATRDALEGFLSVYTKPILPVATKIDRVRPEVRNQVPERFKKNFGATVARADCEELVCVCTAPFEKMFGYGIPLLRRRIEDLAKQAKQHKIRANEEFVQQQAALLTKELSAIAETVVSNLVTIATLGDDCAAYMHSTLQELAQRAHQLGKAHFEQRISTLDDVLPTYYDKWKAIASYQDRYEAKEAARRDLLNYIEVNRLSNRLEVLIQEASAEFVHRCQSEAARRAIQSVQISISGKISHRPQQLRLKMPPVHVELAPSQFELELPDEAVGCAVLAFVALNALLAFSYLLYHLST
ncbi:MAG: hypothetical protein KatS3mg015_1238 [Fimbriimonadales bacterium]|nr:MAG: hypothetical protein KatS3mg015_1238 [Fimbriimonadales bacterium]